MRISSRAIVVKDDTILVMQRNKMGREFYALVGGGVDEGETPEEALHRELEEEASMAVANPRLVIIQEGGAKKFGKQYVYLCEYIGGEPKLSPDSEEALQHSEGQNLYNPMWLPIAELPAVEFLPPELQQALITGLHDGFPEQPLELKISAE
ncbi:MAG TPA: NUDIX domain-containing protein [Candidatus Saccharimonadales bacterium]